MAIPSRFDSNISSTKGVVEAQTFKTDTKEIDVNSLIDAFNEYRTYIVDQATLGKVAFIDGDKLQNFENTFSLDFSTYPDTIKNYINLYVDTSTGYVTYNTDTKEGLEIKISNAVYNEEKVLKDVDGNVLLDINELESNISDINISYDADNDQIVDGSNNLIIDNASQINSIINSINVKYDSDNDKFVDFKGNDLITGVKEINTDIEDLNAEITDLSTDINSINVKYDSDNDKFVDFKGNDLLTEVTQINSELANLQTEYESIGMKYDSGNIVSPDGSTKYLDTELTTERIDNTKNEVIYNIIQDATNGLNTDTILDSKEAFSFAQNTNNAKQIDVTIDTSKLTITDLSVSLTPYSLDDTDAIYIVTYKNITKDKNGNITGFSIVAYDLSGTQLDTYNVSMIVKLA